MGVGVGVARLNILTLLLLAIIHTHASWSVGLREGRLKRDKVEAEGNHSKTDYYHGDLHPISNPCVHAPSSIPMCAPSSIPPHMNIVHPAYLMDSPCNQNNIGKGISPKQNTTHPCYHGDGDGWIDVEQDPLQ